jgi:hypothetical protein
LVSLQKNHKASGFHGKKQRKEKELEQMFVQRGKEKEAERQQQPTFKQLNIFH